MSRSNQKYLIKRNRWGTILLVLTIILIGLGEVMAIISSRASNNYQLTDLTTIEIMTEVSMALLIIFYLLSFNVKGKFFMVLFDLVRFVCLGLSCYCMYTILNQRADLMGYIWFSDLESSNQTAINALNYGVASAALYAAGIIFLAIANGFEFVNAVPIKRTKQEVLADMKALQEEYKEADEDDVQLPSQIK